VQQKFGESHPASLATLSNIASLNRRQGYLAVAESLYQEILDGDRAFFGSDHRYVAADLRNIAEIRVQRGDVATAELLYEESLEIMRQELPGDHRDLGVALREFGELLLETDRADKAVPLLRESLTIHKKAFSDSSRSLAVAEGLLGAGLTAQAAYPEAEEHLLRAYVSMKTRGDSSNPDLQTALDRLARLYEAWGKPEEAARYQSELATNLRK
jgi:hypothetical protein